MTVSPRYSNYTDVRDTGVELPVQLPLDVLHLEEQRQQLEQQLLLQQQQQQQQLLQDAQDAAAQQQQQQHPASSAAVEDVEAAAEMYQRSEYTAAASSSSSSSSSTAAGSAAGGSSSLRYARYYMSCSAGVDRVFVDHPLYNGGSDSSAGSSIPWPAGVLSTYCHPPGSIAAARNAPDLAAAASVLCQAALAAPVLLWGLGDKLDQQQQQAVWSEQQRQLQRDWAMLLQLLGLENEQQQSLDPLDSLLGPGGVFGSINSSSSSSGSSSSSVSALLASAARQREARLAAEMRLPQQVVSGMVQPVLLGTGGSEVDRRWAVCDLLLPQQQRRQAQQQQQQQQGAAAGVGQQQQQGGPVIFVGNDWPCGVLPLWLDAYRDKETAGNSVRKQQQQRQQQEPPTAAGGVQAEQQLQEQQEQMQECVAQSALQQQGREQESEEHQLLPYADWLEQQDQQQQLEVAGLAAQPVLPVQKLQLQETGLQQQQVGPVGMLPDDGDQSPHPSSSSSSSGGGSLLLTDEQSVDDWLTAAGYSPSSVHDRQLTTAVSEAIAAGRVPQERLPGLLAGQSQLQLLLAQEELLGVAIERLKLSAVNVSQTLLQAQQQQQQLPPDVSASAAAGQQQEQLPHARQLQLLQQLLGRQLGDARVVFAIHNYGYQGIFKGRHNFDRLGLPGRMLSAFVSPLARAAARAAAAAGAVTGAAVSAVNSQLAALAGVLQQLSPEHAADRNASSSNNSVDSGSGSSGGGILALSSDGTAAGPGLGLFSSLQAMLRDDALNATAAALVQAEAAQKLQQQQGPDQQGRQSLLEQQQGSGEWSSFEADEGSFDDPELLEGLHDVLAAAAANTGWEPPQENRHRQHQQQQLR
jgi:hypothetical protein